MFIAGYQYVHRMYTGKNKKIEKMGKLKDRFDKIFSLNYHK